MKEASRRLLSYYYGYLRAERNAWDLETDVDNTAEGNYLVARPYGESTYGWQVARNDPRVENVFWLIVWHIFRSSFSRHSANIVAHDFMHRYSLQ